MADDDLLTKLKDLTGTAYLSDLHSMLTGTALREAIRQISPDEYSQKEWEEAIAYILKTDEMHFANAEEAYRYLCEQIMQARK